MVRHNNQLPDNLPQLQNLIKRDPDSYRDEFLQQYRHYQSTLEIFRLSPSQANKRLEDQVMFLAQITQCYPENMKLFPQQLVNILSTHNMILDSDLRMTFCKALILLRNKQLVPPYDLLQVFFNLLRCHDKALRTYLETHIISDIKNINSKHKDAKLNSTLQNFMFSMLKDNNSKAAKMSADIMIELYHKNIWNDSKTVNVIANVGCFSKITKVVVASLKFFLGKDDDLESDSEDDDVPNLKDTIMANKFNKKTRKREKQLAKVKQITKKVKKKKSKAPSFNFSALHLVNNPQGFAENLFKSLEGSNERFEVKLMTLDVISRLIGLHDLFLFNYYPFIIRLIQPHQREVTRILQFAAQAAHELVPPDIMEPVLRVIVNNFVTERNTSDVMAIGLNAVREICSRCPLALSEDLLRDLAQYKNYKERSVMMAARSLIHLYRTSLPELLHKKDRGRPSEALVEIKGKKYGEVEAKDYILGAEILSKKLKSESKEIYQKGQKDSDDSDGWIDVDQSGSEIEIETDSEDGSVDSCDLEEQKLNNLGDEMSPEANSIDKKILKAKKKSKLDESKTEKARELSTMKIFTDEEFKKIEMANLKKHVTPVKGLKRKLEDDLSKEKPELVSLGDIENIYKKRKHDKQTRVESIQKGKIDREKFGYKDGRKNLHCSKTNREKRKNKNYQMIVHKVKGKIKRSFKDKQIALKNYLVKQKKMR